MTVPEDEDARAAALVVKFRGGDQEAFRTLLEQHQEALTARIRCCLPRSLHRKVAVSDVLQESCIVAFQRRGDFEDRGPLSFRNWLLGIVEYKAQEAIRRHERTGKRSARREVSRTGRPATGALAGRVPTPSQLAIGAELEDLARQAFEGLSPDYQEILRLAREEHLSLKEAAARMRRSHAATRQLYGRALCRYREIFKHLTEGRDG